MKLENTLIIITSILFINTLYAYNTNNECEKKLNSGNAVEAIELAKTLSNDYDKNFCQAKAYYRLNKPQEAAKYFETSEKYADLPVDQMFSMLYKGISQRDSNEIDISIASFTKGLETAKLGNSKYMQMEQKFLNQLGMSYLKLNKAELSLESYSKALGISSNDDERAANFKGVAQANAALNNYDDAIEYAVKAANTYQRIGDLGSYADIEIDIAQYYVSLGNTDMAIKNLLSLSNFAKKNGGKYYEAKSAIELASIYKLTGNISESDTQLAKGRRIAKEIGATDLM
jgi:tetratricopeptide (TPR) repeat protein